MKGLYSKYIIQKADGTHIDPSADYFVLRLDTDMKAINALLFYANVIHFDNPILSEELRNKCNHHCERIIRKTEKIEGDLLICQNQS